MIWQEILIILLLILLNAFFALSEIAVVSSRRARLQQYALDGRRGASTALTLADDPTGFLSSVQVGITLIAILAGAYGEAALADPLRQVLEDIPFFAPHASSVSSAIIIVCITFTSLIIGELVPKRIALRNPERLACIVAPPMLLLSKIAHPVIWFLRQVTELALRLFTAPPVEDPRMTEEEVKTLIAEGTEAGVFEPAEKEMLEGVLRVADRSVRTIMTPRPDVVWLDLNDSVEETYDTIAGSGHSRFPVARDDVDNLIGIVHSKDLLGLTHKGDHIDLKSVARDPIYVHEGTPILRLLESFRASTVHMAVVLDEHGTIQGIVTPTDILVAIAGDLPEREGEDEPNAVMRADGSWLLDGQMPVYEVERTLEIRGLSAHEHEYTTLAGFVLSQLGHIPVPGEMFDWNDWRFEVVDLDGRRIDKVLAMTRPPR
jgi:magnesium and cobalt exporter, CNNM family